MSVLHFSDKTEVCRVWLLYVFRARPLREASVFVDYAAASGPENTGSHAGEFDLLRHLSHFCNLTKQGGAVAFGLHPGLAIGIDADAADT